MNKILMSVLAVVLVSLPAAGQDGGLVFEDAWVRALPPSQSNTAAYLTLVNRSGAAIGIVGASADVAQKVEIHTSRKVDGFVRMQELEGLALAAGETLTLAPGGTHLMLLDLSFMPVPGDIVKLCLRLLAGEEVCTEAETRRTAAANAQPHH